MELLDRRCLDLGSLLGRRPGTQEMGWKGSRRRGSRSICLGHVSTPPEAEIHTNSGLHVEVGTYLVGMQC